MQNWKKWTGALLALALITGTMAGCSGGGTSSQASSGTGSSSAVSSAVSSPASSEASASSSASSAAESGSDFSYSDGLTEAGFFEGVTALDYVKLPDYKGIELPEGTLDVSEESLQDELDERLSYYQESAEVKDRAVKDGDTVNIDYVGSVDGEEFSGGSTQGNGTEVTIGVTSYIDDFLEQLIGHKPGETFDVSVTFPDPYENNTSLSGKDAVFKTTINFIVEKKNPELTDEFVAEHWKDSDGWTTVDQLKEGVTKELKRDAAWAYLWEQISQQAEVSQVPEAIVRYHEGSMKFYAQAMAAQYGMDLDDFLSQAMGVESLDELIEQKRDVIDENAKKSLILQAICEDSGFSVTDEELTSYLTKTVGTSDTSKLEEYYGKPYLFLMAREDLIQDNLGTEKSAE